MKHYSDRYAFCGWRIIGLLWNVLYIYIYGVATLIWRCRMNVENGCEIDCWDFVSCALGWLRYEKFRVCVEWLVLVWRIYRCIWLEARRASTFSVQRTIAACFIISSLILYYIIFVFIFKKERRRLSFKGRRGGDLNMKGYGFMEC